MEEDWLMKQIKLVGKGMGAMLKKKMSSIDLGEIKREDGSKINCYDL